MDNEAARGILTKYLKERGRHRSTASRFAVLDAVLAAQGHFDAESLYYRMITNGVKVSKATVYNSLELLKECGLVSKYRFVEKVSRYEKAFGKPHHHHLVCLTCGDIIEFVDDKLERLQEEICREKEFETQSSSIQVFGVCARCRKKA
jgi:Fur family ferric uptake transcriptional regulator